MTADSIGGVWTFSLDLIHALRDEGVQFALATMGRKLTPAQRATVEELENVSLYESELKLEWMEDPWDDVDRAAEWLLEIASDFRPDLVHLNGYAHAALPWECPVLVAAHSCVYSWFTAVKGLPPPRDPWKIYHRYVREGLKAASMVTAPTQAMLDALNIHYGDTFPTGEAIFNGRSQGHFRSAFSEEIVLTAGRLWDEAKNIRILEDAAAQIEWPILVAGEREHPDGGSVSFSDLQHLGLLCPDAFADQLARASIYALPARYEPFGLSALEAGLSGCALVLGDIPSLREVWGDAALFVAPDDAAAWTEALQELVSNAPLRETFARRARERAQKFTPERMAEGYLRAYRSILNTENNTYENRSFLPFTPVGLESRKRPLSARLRHRAAAERSRGDRI